MDLDAAGRIFHARCRTFILESEAQIGKRTAKWYALKLAEEAGEAVGAFNRTTGLARRMGTKEELAKELCQVIMSAFILAEKLDMTLPLEADFQHVMTRGFRAE